MRTLSSLELGALIVLAIGGAGACRAAEPVRTPAADRVGALKLAWVEPKREEELRNRLLRLDRMNPRMQALANALWRDDNHNGFSLDVDPGDDEVVLYYRVRF
jgi:hypothetical protein